MLMDVIFLTLQKRIAALEIMVFFFYIKEKVFLLIFVISLMVTC